MIDIFSLRAITFVEALGLLLLSKLLLGGYSGKRWKKHKCCCKGNGPGENLESEDKRKLKKFLEEKFKCRTDKC